MKKNISLKNLTVVLLAWTMLVLPTAAIGQTRISLPRNKYKVQDDVKLGQQASSEVERQMPILDDYDATRYIQQVGDRLVRGIPAQFRQPAFDYRFKVVNASDINAFALPGGPMYVNRGMIEAARSEGEMAGVMAHEIAHIALRHGTSQATKQSNPLNQLGTIGLILGGAILGGQTGAQLGALGAQAWMTSYSRDYESQADILGAQIMANASYDPRDLANMFRTIERESGGSRAPEWLSSHPNPANRYEAINREAQLLRVSPNEAVQDTRAFQNIQNRLSRLPRAQTMAEIAQSGQRQDGRQSPTVNGRYENSVQYPSPRTRNYSSGNWVSMNVPENWQTLEEQNQVWFAPQGAYGNNGITHGALIGVSQANSNNLAQASENYVNNLLQTNSYLQQRSNFTRTNIGGRQGYSAILAGRSNITGRNEVVTIYTTLLRNGTLFHAATVAPENEYSRYQNAFRNMLGSIRLND